MPPEHWARTTLGAFVTLQRGHDLPEQDRRPGGTPILGSFGITGWHDVPKAPGPGVTVGRSGASFGVVCFSPVPFWPLNTALYVVDFHGNDPRFAYYFLKHFDFKPHNSGSAQPSLNRNFVHPLPVAVPPVREQHAIAAVLGALDEKIELNRRTNETLEAMARALFKSWFVDFDPVRMRAEGPAPGGVEAATARIFGTDLVESEQGSIPKGWSSRPLGEYVTALSGGTPSKGDPLLWGGNLAWISPKVMTAIHADEADDFVTPAAVGNGTRIAPAGSTLVMVRGMGLHQEVRVSQARREVTFNQDVKALVPQKIDATLLLFAMLNAQRELLSKVETSGHGTGKLPTDILLSHRIALPPLAEQTGLALVFDSISRRIEVGRHEVRTLARLRDELLPRLLSGEVSVAGLASLPEAVA